MRWWLGVVALVGCRDSGPSPVAAEPTPAIVVIAAAAATATAEAAPVRTGPPIASLVLDAKPSKRIIVTPHGAVRIDGHTVELAKLAGALPRPRDRWRAPGSTSPAREQLLDGMLWIRVSSLAHRPLMVAESSIPAIRVFEVARAAEPVGAAIEVVDPSGRPHAFGYRVIDARDHDNGHIDSVAEITIDQHRIVVGERELPLTATAAELRAAVVETQTAPSDPTALRWGFLTIEGWKTPIAIAITAMDAMAAVDIVGISITAGEPGKPHIEIGTTEHIARRHLKRHREYVMRCYETWLEKHPATAGRVELAWSVGADGIARAPRATQIGLDDQTASCVAAVFAKVEIPKQVGPTLVVRLVLEPDGG